MEEKRIKAFNLMDILKLRDFKLKFNIEIKPYHLIICGVAIGAIFTYNMF
jgi:hypothetical protein